jgi:hypothetical protein
MNWFWAVVGAAVIYIVVSMIWYSQMLFGKAWMKLAKVNMKNTKHGMFPSIIGSIIVALIIAYFLACMVHRFKSFDFMNGAGIGFWIWLGFVATTEFSNVLWAKKPFKMYLIDTGCWLVTFVLMGGAIGFLLNR